MDSIFAMKSGISMAYSRPSACAILCLFLAGVTLPVTRGQVTGLRGMRDHSLCCAMGMPNIHGIDGSFEPAPDPVLSRRRAPAPPVPPSSASPAQAAGVGHGVNIPGVDTFVTETPAPARSTAESSGDAATAVEPAYPPLVLPSRKVDGHLDVGFETLGGFAFKLTKTAAIAIGAADASALAMVNAQIPDVIRQLDGRKVVVTGYMLPMKIDGALTTEFLLVANSMLCCYGVVPPMNQWATVKMQKRGVTSQPDVPVQVFGTLRVQTRIENGALSAIYHIEAERTHPPK